ncbi:MAG: hypothetical protein RIS45_1940 [Planctomycetota bacterium]|jgi:hypothetical protein
MAVGISFESDDKQEERTKATDAHLDALLGPKVEEPREEPPAPEKAAEASPPAPVEPEKVAAKGPETPVEQPVEIDDPAAREKKRADGLQRELAELRKKNQELLYERQRDQLSRQAPSPVREAPAPQAAPEPKRRGLPVTVEENEVFVPEDVALQLARRAAREEFEERTRPTPEQVAQAETQRAVSEFVMADPGHQAVAEQVVSAGQMIELAIQNRMLQAGPFMSLEHTIDYLEQSGVATQIAEYFPAVGEHLRDFIEAFGSRETGWKRSVLHQIARSAARQAPADPGMAPVVPSPAAPRLARVNAPPPVAKMGGSRAQPESDLDREFNRLLKAYTDDPFIPAADYKRLQTLGKQLGKPNF